MKAKSLKMMRHPRVFLISALVAAVFSATGVGGQTRGSSEPTVPPPLREQSELALDNEDRVAASPGQVRQVLLQDPGLLVEVKRLIAKEATAKGQIVEDVRLTDQAVFERLDEDVVFRSHVTRLLQRFGYLLPTINPDSPTGKQQDMLLKERARRMVQIEAQEDAETARPLPPAAAQAAPCDRNDAECAAATPAQKRRRAPNVPLPDSTIPLGPRPTDTTDGANLLQASSPSGAAPASGPQLGFELNNASLRRESVGSSTPLETSMAAAGSMSPSVAATLAPNFSSNIPGNVPAPSSMPSGRVRPASAVAEEDPTAVRMLHKTNPYADIPSLYDMYVQPVARGVPQRFGLDVFKNGSADPDNIAMDLPAGPEYVVGPGDGLAIDLWGGIAQRLIRTVDREGRIALPEVGPLLVSGRSLVDVQRVVQQVMRSQFRDVSADVSLARLRTVRVYVVGDVAAPGAYDISSLSTPLNALFAAGGVTGRGSLRSLKHFRGKQLVQEVDAYDLLLHGVRSELSHLENGDTLMVPPIGPQITIDGMVRRPAIYELHGETNLAEALELSGGILPTAALRHIEVQRVEAHAKRTMLSLDVDASENREAVTKQLAAFKVLDGDEVHIFPISFYNQGALYLQGHVLRPGRYSYRQGMKLTDLVASYADLMPEPAAHYAEIVRINPPDFHPSVESFDLAAALADPAAAPKLQPLDTVRIFGRFDFEPVPTVSVVGEVRTPGEYKLSGQVHLRDAIFLAGGLSPDAALDSAQLFRTLPDGSTKIMSVSLQQAIEGSATENILLLSRDRLLIHRNAARLDPPVVYVTGEVANPGKYPLAGNMRLRDLLRTAGGLKRSADLEAADLTRFTGDDPQKNHSERVEVDLAGAMNGNDSADLPLRDGDVLAIRQVSGRGDLGASVSLRGEIQHPGTFGLKPGERLSSLLERAGGFTAEAFPYGAVLMRREVRDLEEKSYSELMRRVQAQQVLVRTLPENDSDQRSAKLAAAAQTQTALDQLQKNPPIGRLVVHIDQQISQWRNSSADTALRDGDVLVIPKRANYVLVGGQVYNPTAIAFRPGKSARWYLSQAGGYTSLANSKGVFVIRADGSVLSGRKNSVWWLGDPMNAVLKPGDSIIVPEKAVGVPGRNWGALLQAAQIASSVAITVSYIATRP